jgi:short-subunit dehydrogenase
MASPAARKFAFASLAALTAGAIFASARARRNAFFDLRGKNALVTGGARGLGLEIARVLVSKGANVMVVARDAEEIARAISDLKQHAASSDLTIAGEVCDLTDGEAIEPLLSRIRSEFGVVDVLVNNAGTIQVGPLSSMTVDDFESAMRLHCFAPLRLVLGLREGMRSRGGGRVANISSIGGLVSVPHLLPYSASKFALIGLSQGLRMELAREKIMVSTIAPGLMRTGSPGQASFKGDHQKEYAWFAISDALPLLSASSSRSARRIVRAIERGEPHLVIGAPAKLAALANGVLPSVVTRALTVVNAALPSGQDQRERKGFESESELVPSFVTGLNERAAERNNET